MKCPRCGNLQKSYFYKGSHGYYCRKCIGFGRLLLEEDETSLELQAIQEDCSEYTMQYPLTKFQEAVSKECQMNIRTQDVLLECVCGAGKTEMVLASIADALNENRKVCFAIARRQVVLELSERLKTYFKKAKIIAVCGGHTDEIDGDLIVCTTHQLYRYQGQFSLLILDEPDAFPYRGDEVLHGIAQHACIGHVIYLTATPDNYLLSRVQEGTMRHIVLNKRPHGHDLPVPRLCIYPSIVLFWVLLRWINKHTCNPRIIFVPTIKTASILGKILSIFMKCYVCTSESEDRDRIIYEFKKESNGIMIATTVLERGVTIPKADICVWHANHSVFDEAGLIQMAGRAGRSFTSPEGDVLFLCSEKTELVQLCKEKIEQANHVCIV
ncbi:helicase-related protein [Solobacterium moorei]|uniref:helicase-related protein n=1 Tax=Solobacterium moorei TaxID=102148 RepID=UPI0023F2627E|nr:helicase-related protein [Solobacterium moorei]